MENSDRYKLKLLREAAIKRKTASGHRLPSVPRSFYLLMRLFRTGFNSMGTTPSSVLQHLKMGSSISQNRILSIAPISAVLIAISVFIAGCAEPETSRPAPTPTAAAALATLPPAPPADEQILREGDAIRISFPGAPNMETVSQEIRNDGRVTLPIIGEVVATNKTPNQLEKELSKLYAPDLVSSEVTVALQSSSAAYFVTGEVLKPGKIMPNRPISALEAVMEAGGFISDKADTTAVVIIRNENGHTKNYTVNLKRVIEGKDSDPFGLKPFDIVFVPQKLSMF
jgi:polysaccharide export outer membrane protein